VSIDTMRRAPDIFALFGYPRLGWWRPNISGRSRLQGRVPTSMGWLGLLLTCPTFSNA